MGDIFLRGFEEVVGEGEGDGFEGIEVISV